MDVEKELDRLVAEDIIEPVQYSDWATPIFPTPKTDDTVRISGDYKLTVNRAFKLTQYPLPRIKLRISMPSLLAAKFSLSST